MLFTNVLIYDKADISHSQFAGTNLPQKKAPQKRSSNEKKIHRKSSLEKTLKKYLEKTSQKKLPGENFEKNLEKKRHRKSPNRRNTTKFATHICGYIWELFEPRDGHIGGRDGRNPSEAGNQLIVHKEAPGLGNSVMNFSEWRNFFQRMVPSSIQFFQIELGCMAAVLDVLKHLCVCGRIYCSLFVPVVTCFHRSVTVIALAGVMCFPQTKCMRDFGLLLLMLDWKARRQACFVHVCIGVSDKQTTSKAINIIEHWKTCWHRFVYNTSFLAVCILHTGSALCSPVPMFPGTDVPRTYIPRYL